MQPALLVVEDDAQQRQLVCQLLQAEQYQVIAADSVEAAIVLLKQQPQLALVFSDWKLGNGSGQQILQYVRRNMPELGFVVATAYGSVSHAVEAIQAGADDYLAKPFKRQELLLAVAKGLNARNLRQQNRQLTEQLSEQRQLVDLIGNAPCMQTLFSRINRVSNSNASILISGESGTGKELAARAIHQLSARSSGAFIAINCGAIPEQLAEAELFGSEKGAFTGAHQAKAGKFEAASGGTIFLDEVAELPLNLQAKLLRLLQEGKVTRLGSNREISLDIRLIAASHQDLAQAVQQGRFREDLYYRLNVVPIHMPALRERRDDIPRLIRHFLNLNQQRYQLQLPELSKTTLKRLMDYAWPGNVRQLANCIERFTLLADEQELLDGLNETPASAGFTLPATGLNWQQHERDCLQQALHQADGNKARAAKLLQLPYKTFLYRLDKFQLKS